MLPVFGKTTCGTPKELGAGVGRRGGYQIPEMVEGLRCVQGMNVDPARFRIPARQKLGRLKGIFKLASGNCALIGLISKCKNFKKKKKSK